MFFFAGDILQHFRIFELYNTEMKTKATFAGPSLPQKEVKKRVQKVLPAGDNSTSEKT